MEYGLIFVGAVATCFLLQKVESTSLSRDEEFIKTVGVIILMVLGTALCISEYNQHKYETASVKKADNIEVVNKKTVGIDCETIVKYKGKKYKSVDDDLYKNVKIGERLKGHVVKGKNELHDVDGYAVTEKQREE